MMGLCSLGTRDHDFRHDKGCSTKYKGGFLSVETMSICAKKKKESVETMAWTALLCQLVWRLIRRGFKYILQVDVTKCHFVIVDKGGIVEICYALEWGVFYSCPYIVHILEYNK